MARRKKLVTPWLSQFIDANTDLATRSRISDYDRDSYAFARQNEAYADSLITDWRNENDEFIRNRQTEPQVELPESVKTVSDYLDIAENIVSPGLYVSRLMSKMITGSDQVSKLNDNLVYAATHPLDLTKSLISDFGQQVNKFQAGAFQGLITRSNVLDNLIDEYKRYASELQDLLLGKSQDFSQLDLNQVQKMINLQQRMDKLERDISQYIPGSSYPGVLKEAGRIQDWYSDLANSTVGNLFNFISDNTISGKSTQLHDEFVDITKNLRGFQDAPDINTKLQTLQRVQNSIKEKQESWKDGYLRNKEEESWWKNNVTQSDYQKWKSLGDINLLDWDTYFFKLPGILAGTASSWLKHLSAMALGQLGMRAAEYGGLAAAFLPVLGLNYSSSLDENNMEVAEHTKNKFIEKLLSVQTSNNNIGTLYDKLIKEGRSKLPNSKNLTDEDVVDAALAGLYEIEDPRIIKAMGDLGKGIENMFYDEMAATAGSDLLTSALEVFNIPGAGKIYKSLKKYGRYARRQITNPTARKVIESKLGRSIFEADHSAALQRGAILGPAAAALNVPLHVIFNPLEEKIGKSMLYKQILAKFDGIGAAITADETQPIFSKALRNATKSAYARGIGGKVIQTSIAESIEEGSQNYSARRYKNDEYDSLELKKLFDTILDNFLDGSRSAGLLLGMPFGITPESDRDILNEMKGGLIGGHAHSTTISIVQNALPYIKQQKANEVLATTLFADKASKLDHLQTAKLYSQYSRSDESYSTIRKALDDAKQLNERYKEVHGQYAIDPEDIDQNINQLNRVRNIANNPLVIRAAIDAGINVPNSKWSNLKTIGKKITGNNDVSYDDFVSLVSLALNEYKNSADRSEEKLQDLMDLQNQIRQQIQDESKDQIVSNLQDLAGFADEVEIAQSPDVSNQSKQNWTDNFGNTDFAYTNAIAEYAALLEYRDELEKGLTINGDNKNVRVKRQLKQILNLVNGRIKDLRKVSDVLNDTFVPVELNGAYSVATPIKRGSIDDVNDVEKMLVFRQSEHQQLKEAHKERLQAEVDESIYADLLTDVMGKSKRTDKNGTPTQFEGSNAIKLIRDVYKNVNDDNDLIDKIETVYHENLRLEREIEENPAGTIEDYQRNNFSEQWQDLASERRDPLVEALKPRQTREDVDKLLRDSFVETWNRTTGTSLPMTPEGMEDRRRYELYRSELAKSQTVVAKNNNKLQEKPAEEPWKPTFDNNSRYVSEYYKTRNRLVPPPPIVPSGQIVTEPEQELTPQEETLQMIDQKYENDKEVVLRDRTTSQDYFVVHDGKVIRMSRVHNVMPESYIHKDQACEVNSIFNQLKSLNSIKDLKNWFDENNITKDIYDSYYKYITDNEGTFFSVRTPESAKEYTTTLRHLAQHIVNAKRSVSISIRMGRVADELFRTFFEDSNLYKQTYSEDAVLLLYNSTNAAEGRTYEQLFQNFDIFSKLIGLLRDRYSYYTNTLGWQLRTFPLVWRANFNGIGWVAGETDMVGVDQNGDIHIIDFKTSMHTFGVKYTPNIKITDDYASYLKLLSKDDFNNGKLGKKARNILRAIKDDTRNNHISIQWNSDLNQDGFNNGKPGKAVVVNKHMPFVSTPNKAYGQILSAYANYSNQQTAYARIMQLETGGSVTSIEIMPALCDYDEELRVIYKTILEPRTMLTFSKQMLDILDGVSNSELETAGILYRQLESLYNTIQQKRNYIVSKISEDIFNIISDTAKVVYSDFISAANDFKLPIEYDVDEILAYINRANGILNEYYNAVKFIREDYHVQKAKELLRIKQLQKNTQREQHIQEQPAGEAVSTRNATNKNKSYGNTSRTNLNYRAVEADRDLELATSSPDFITSADFNVYLEGNSVFVDITHRGKTWKRVPIDTAYNGIGFAQGLRLIEDIKTLLKSKKDGLRIVPVRSSMNRTAGRIKIAQDKDGRDTYLLLKDTDLFAGEDIYDIEFSSAYNNIGLIDNSMQAVTFGETDTQRNTIYTWRNPNAVPAKGTLIYLKHVRKDELSKDSIIPIAIDRVKITDADANFIVSLLQNPGSLDKEYYTVNGQNVHATGRLLANLIIPIVDDPSQLGNITSLLRDPSNPNIVRLMNRTNLASNSVGRGQYDISVPAQLASLTEELKTMSIAETHDLLLARLGNNKNSKLPFAGIRKFFIENNGDVSELKISDSIVFDVDDFKTVTSKTGVQRAGLNGFGYYLKHNLLRTQYAGMGACNVEIKEVMLEDTNAPEIQNTGALQIPEATPEVVQTTDVDEVDAFLLKLIDKSTEKKKKLTEEKARKHLYDILGENVPLEFREGFLTVASGAAHVVGNCKADAIILSNLAWEGVEFHEAYHRIFETLIPENQRDIIYQKIAKRLGVHLYDDNGNENLDAFRECTEWAADRYMEHMNFHMTDLKIPFLTKAWNRIYDWVLMFIHFGDRELYKTFIEVNKGIYRNIKPNQKQINRFNRMYKELYAYIHGVNFKNIVNKPMYDKLKETVLFCIIQGLNVDKSGRNIQEVGKHIDRDTFKAGIDKILKLGYDIIGQNTDTPSVGQMAMREIYDNFNNEFIRDDIANSISAISTDFVKVREQESNEDAQGDEQSVSNANIGEHTRSSYEFSRFEKTSSRVRFFFATIPDSVYGDPVKTVKDGKEVIVRPRKLALNELGLPRFVPVNVVFNEVLNYFHDVDSVSELLERLQEYGKQNPMYKTIYTAINNAYKKVYTMEDGKIVRNSDQEALVSQLMNVIRSNRYNFDIARSNVTNGQHGLYTIKIQPSGTEYNAMFYPTQWNLMLVNGGTPIIKLTPDGRLLFNPKIKGVETSFKRLQDLFSHPIRLEKAANGAVYNDVGIRQWLSNAYSSEPKQVYLKLKVNGSVGYYGNPKDPELLDIVISKIVEALNTIGIAFNRDEFDYMLRHKYGSSDAEALLAMFSSTAKSDSMTSFINLLGNISTNNNINREVNVSGKKVKLENVYSKIAFIKDLANWKYQYRHAHDQLTVLATGNNKFYEISDNNYISDVARFLNKRGQEFEEIKSDVYNYFKDYEHKNVLNEYPTYGSLILEELTDNPNAFITLRNFIGFKTDKKNDQGSDYFEISKREDYVSKASILENGGIIMPTLSDKKTWLYIDGIKLPGLDYSSTIDDNGNIVPLNNLGEQFVIPKDPVSQWENMLTQDPEVISRFISYAITEYMSVLKADADLDEMERNGTKSTEVDNYYTEEQGAKFSSLIGVWDYDYKEAADGSMQIVGETFHSFNNNKKSRKDNIKEAEKYFFNRTREEQEVLIQRLLHKQFLKEVDTCLSLGLIKLTGTSENLFENYENVGFNNTAIEAIFKSLVVANGNPIDAIATLRYKSLAVLIYINDISNKAIMSGQEVERVFSGNPAYYKWKYDSNGNLIDRTVDELKRLGGLVSTGNNNFAEIKDIPQKYLDESGNFTGKYKCAQVNNELIESPQLQSIEKFMRDGEITTAAYLQRESKEIEDLHTRFDEIDKMINSKDAAEVSDEDRAFYDETVGRMDEVEQELRIKISKEIDSTPVEQLEESLDDVTKSIVERKAKEATDSYRLKYKNGEIDDGIDVADGGAYITDTMAEMLLRMNGNYSASIEKAFKILREETRANILEKQQAYKDVLTEVIGTLKYTAFGRRKHPVTGVLVAYYNKMALFPLFQCMSTGKMQNIFNKMKLQGIDMLMVDSAVKLGGQYSKGISWDEFMQNEDESDPRNHIGNDVNNPLKPAFDESFEFGTYEQNFMYLRKQLNTDPTEDPMMDMGTQMTKIVMTNLLDGREYYLQNGRVLNGMELRNDIMNTINTMSDRGLNNIMKRFFKTDSDGNFTDSSGNVVDVNSGEKVLDEVKFSREMLKMMQSKDPDKNILDALEIVEEKDDDGTVRKHMKLPLNAISNSNWLESVLISSINKKVIDIETPGAAFIQRSVWAMEGSALFERSKGNILGDENLSPKINNGERLQMINEEGSMDCVVSVDFFKKMFGGELPKVPVKDKNRNVVWDLVPQLDKNGNAKRDENGKIMYVQRRDENGKPMVDDKGNPVYKRRIRTREMTFEELRNWALKRNIIGKGATASIIGYRIPTQAESSIHALRIVDVLPVVNDTIILPAEFTKITGSDFDIDKLFLSSVLYKVHRQEGEDGKFHQTITDQFKDTEDAYYQNKLIRDYIALLLDWKSYEDHTQRSVNILHRSIDNDTKLLKDIIKDIESGQQTEKEEAYGFYTLSKQTESKNDYITGKIGIGPFALNNNNHILTMMYHVKFKHIDSSIMNALDLESLDNRQDKNKESIMSWLSALINAHVDIAKDPYISRLNVGPFTYNIVNLLVRTGLGDKTFYFTSQPIMRALADAYVNAGAMYMADPHKSKYILQQEAIEEVADKWFKDSGITFKGLGVLDLINIVKEGGIRNADIRKEINGKIKTLFDNELKLDAKRDVKLENQFFYYLAYLQFDKYANALANLVTYSKIDTKKHGKSVTEQLVYYKGYTNTYDIYRESSLFDPVGLGHMQRDSYIGVKTSNAIDSVHDILGHQFIQSSPAFLGTVDKILKAIGRNDSLSANLVQKVSNALSAAIKSKFFVEEYVPSITNNPNFIHDLVSESTETMDFTVKQQGNIVSVSGEHNHNLSSYINGDIHFVYKGQDGNNYVVSSSIVGVDEQNNTLTIAHNLPSMYGKAVLKNGKNTIYDRLLRLYIDIQTNPAYEDLRDGSGNITNRLLQMLVPGKEVEYTSNYIHGEQPDTYETMKFVKFFNFVEDSGSTSNYIIDAWDELLQYTNADKNAENTIREFARDLIVYGFITSGDRGGFTKIFKYVPASWRESSGYGNFMYSKLLEYSIGSETDIDIDDVILNNWFDNDIVRTYGLKDKNKVSQFIQYKTRINGLPTAFPTVLAALKRGDNGNFVASINPTEAPLFIKIRRRSDRYSYDSQRRFTVFKLHKIAISNNGTEYPVYVKVNPKGNQIGGGFLITEYGRSDAVGQQEYSINEQVLEQTYKAANIGQYIANVAKTEPIFASIVEGLNRAYNREQERSSVVDAVVNNVNTLDEQRVSQPVTLSDTVINIYAGTGENAEFDVAKAEFYSGAAEGADKAWGAEARALGIKVIDYTRESWNALPQEWKDKLSSEYEEVAAALARPIIPLGNNGDIEVRRDMMLADKADAIFAIGSVVRPGLRGAKYINRSNHDVVDGGTGYAVQRGIIRDIPVYVFDQPDNQWKVWDKNSNTFITTSEPTITPHAATIGTRGINDAGRQAIRSILAKTLNQQLSVPTIVNESSNTKEHEQC